MRVWAGYLLVAALAVPGLAHAQAAKVDHIAVTEEVLQAERDFAADTKANGFHRGFIAWSTPDAIGFLPQAANFHASLAADLAADPTLADKPTKLRWGPFYAGVASSGDLAFDLGPWTIEGTDRAGWFFTIWQKQADGTWRWTLDGGAGKDTPANLPAEGRYMRLISNVDKDIPAGLEEGLAQDDARNLLVAQKPAAEVFAGIGGTQPVIASDDVAPFIPGNWPYPEQDGSPPPPPGAMDAFMAVKTAAIAARPAPGLVWTRDGQGASKAGDYVYTYGRAVAADGTYVGHYVRLWDKVGEPGTWVLLIDVFQK